MMRESKKIGQFLLCKLLTILGDYVVTANDGNMRKNVTNDLEPIIVIKVIISPCHLFEIERKMERVDAVEIRKQLL